jgi:flagellar hook-length control protein FliK
MSYTQPRTSALEIFLPPDPPEAPPPEAGPPDRGSHFKGLLEGQTNARTAPAEGEKKKGPRANSAAPAEGSPTPQHEGVTSEAPQGTGTTGTPAEGLQAEAAAQSEPNATLIGGEASGAAGAAVAVGAAAAAPLTSSSSSLGEPQAGGAGGVTPRNNSGEVPGSDTPGSVAVSGEDEGTLAGEASVVTSGGSGASAVAAQIVLPASAEAVTGEETTPAAITVPTTPAVPKTGGETPAQSAAGASQGEAPATEVSVEGREGEGSPGDRDATNQTTTPVPQPKGDESAAPEATASESAPPTQTQATATAPQATAPTGVPIGTAAPTQAAANSPTHAPSFASPQGPAPSPASALEATVRMAAENGYSRARVALRPAELGGIELLLRGGNGGLTATVVAETPQAAQLLEHAAADLQRRLSAQGIELTSLQIGVGGESAGAAQGGRDQGGEASPAAGGTHTGTDEDLLAAPEQTQTIDLGGGVLVDVLA